ncbi:pyruvate kinase PyKII [Toxoplasma gondii CAST]|uniref:pyruvate kinase n=1 Tax=Toxoplasma gondii CAST TaxID=943122 RepID=A0A3R8A6K7_TOXGO|nr:pyruvate kinase PyKII [Toxoplasma gondii CAST]
MDDGGAEFSSSRANGFASMNFPTCGSEKPVRKNSSGFRSTRTEAHIDLQNFSRFPGGERGLREHSLSVRVSSRPRLLLRLFFFCFLALLLSAMAPLRPSPASVCTRVAAVATGHRRVGLPSMDFPRVFESRALQRSGSQARKVLFSTGTEKTRVQPDFSAQKAQNLRQRTCECLADLTQGIPHRPIRHECPVRFHREASVPPVAPHIGFLSSRLAEGVSSSSFAAPASSWAGKAGQDASLLPTSSSGRRLTETAAFLLTGFSSSPSACSPFAASLSREESGPRAGLETHRGMLSAASPALARKSFDFRGSALRHFSSSGGHRGSSDTKISPGHSDKSGEPLDLPVFTSTKQIATIGPASWDYEEIERLFLAGVDVFRLNMSHGLLTEKHQQLLHVRHLEKVYKHPIAVLADLPGPKFRLGVFNNDEATLETGKSFILDSSTQPGDASRVQLPHPEILSVLRPDDIVLMDDGKVKLRVTEVFADTTALSTGLGDIESVSHTASPGSSVVRAPAVRCTVLVGGRISSKKGVNVPSARLPISALSARDRELARTVASWGVDWIALSFVQSADDVHELRRELREAAEAAGSTTAQYAAEQNRSESHVDRGDASGAGCRIRPDISVMVKIEKPIALENIAEIVAAADGIMVARGDLGVELPNIAWLPRVQKRLVSLCREAGKPVVVATQMLESMMQAPLPTRAEVSDVANAVYDGADAVMLSGETAAGNAPARVACMQRLGIEGVENDPSFWELEDQRRQARLRAAERCASTGTSALRVPRASKGREQELEKGSELQGESRDRTEEILSRFLPGRREHLAFSEADRQGNTSGDTNQGTSKTEQGADESDAWVEHTAAAVARQSGAKAIVVFGENEALLQRLATLRPTAPVLAVTECVHTARRLKMYWGIYPVLLEAEDQANVESRARRPASLDDQLRLACEFARKEKFATESTDNLVVLGRLPGGRENGTNSDKTTARLTRPILTVCTLESGR